MHPSLHHAAQRKWSEPQLHSSQLIYPLFVSDKSQDVAISGFSPNVQWGGDFSSLRAHLVPLIANGLTSVMLFGVVTSKDDQASEADTMTTPILRVIRLLAQTFPSLLIAADVCLCEYTDHGHCGLLVHEESPGNDSNSAASVRDDKVDVPLIDNTSTLVRLSAIAVAYATAGCHIVAPSDMMDHRIAALRTSLNTAGFPHVSIMAYTSKKASCMYAPFRQAVDSSFQGDRKRYQHPVGSLTHATRAYARDVATGADSVIVKPSLFYTDIVRTFANTGTVPVVCYVVSGEYKMLMDYGTSAECLLDVVREAHTSLLRAGASVLITYFTPYILTQLASKSW